MLSTSKSFLLSLPSRKSFTLFFWVAVVLYSTFMLFVCFHSKNYFRANDALYYLSVAENLLDNGLFMDGTQTPNGPVITPQNGIVGLFFLLRVLSFSKHQILLFMLILNYALTLSSIFPLVEISKAVGLTKRHLIFLMIGLFLGNIRIFQWLFLAPVNDMIFYSGELWLLYLFICIDRHFSNERPLGRGLLVFHISAGILISLVIIHFRVNSIFLPLGGIVSALLVRRFKMLTFFVILLAGMSLSLFSIFLFFDTFDFSWSSSGVELLFSDFMNQLYVFLFGLLPESLFKDLQSNGNLLYVPFYISMLIAFIQGVKTRNLHLLLILFICAMTFVMTIVHGNITERFLWVVVPFMYMMLFRIKAFRTIGYLFVFAVLANTIWMIPHEMKVSRSVLTWENIAGMDVLKSEKVVMISRDARSCWYFTGIQSVYQDKYAWSDLEGKDLICLIGSEEFIETHKKRLEELARENVHRIEMVNIPCGPPGKPRFLFYKVILKPQEMSIYGKYNKLSGR